MLRHSISKRQKPVGTHCDFVESLRIVGVESCDPLPHRRVAHRVETTVYQPAFLTIHGEHEGHDARSFSGAGPIRLPESVCASIGSVVRSVPAKGFLAHAVERLAIPVSRRRSPLPRAFRIEIPSHQVVEPSLLEKVHRFPPLGGKRTVRGARRSFAG